MSTSATPMGARPCGTVVGSPYQGKVTHYKIKNAYGTSIFFGDFVKWGDDNPNTTIQKDTGLSRTTIHRTLQTLTKLNVISTIKGRSGKTYQINTKFVKFEKGMFQNETPMFQNYTSNVSDLKTLVETININTIEDIIRENRGNQQSIIDSLAKLPLTDLKKDKNNPYYMKLAIARKEELAAESKANYVHPQKIIQALNKIKKETNVRYKEKRDYNIRNNIKPWQK